MAFQNSRDVDARGAVFNNVGGDQFNVNQQIQVHIQERDIRILLSPVEDAAYNRDGPVSTCLQDTRKELIAKILNWADKDSDRPICWLNGPAGSGKSAVSQTVAEWFAARNRLAASFFFFRGAGNRSKIAHFVTTLAYQLSISVPDTRSLIQSVLRVEPSISERSRKYQFQRLIIEPILTVRKSVLNMLKLWKPIVIVIDALDECDDKDLMADFIDIIINTFQENPRLPLRVFFTSRVEEHIRKKLESDVARSTTYSLNLQDFDARVDIHTFFRSRFSTIFNENRRLLQGIPLPWPSGSDVNALVRKSDGSFIFAVTLINFINDASDLPHRKIQKALEVDNGLDHLYTQVLSAAPHGPHFGKVIGTIMVLSRPLSIVALGYILTLEAADILHALLGIQSILMIPGDDSQPVQLFHTSLRDFLTTEQRSRELFIDPPAHHFCLVIICLKAITEPLGNAIVFSSEVGLYACLNWCHHLHQFLISGQENSNVSWATTLMGLLDVLSQSLGCWVNTIILEGKEESCSRDLNQLLSMLKKLPSCPQNVKYILNDIKRHVELDIDDFHDDDFDWIGARYRITIERINNWRRRRQYEQSGK